MIHVPLSLTTVDGSELLHQLRLVVYPIIYKVLHISGGWPFFGFLKHQQSTQYDSDNPHHWMAGICTIRGTDIVSPHGIPVDLLDRLVIIRTEIGMEEKLPKMKQATGNPCKPR